MNRIIGLEYFTIMTKLDYQDCYDEIEELVNDILDEMLEKRVFVDVDKRTMLFLNQDYDRLVINILDYYRNYDEERVISNFFYEVGEDSKMTKEEQDFAEQHHDEVYRFLKGKKLSIEEHYDIVIIGFLHAVKDYHRKPSARAYAFEAVETRAMTNTLYKHWRAESAEKRKLNHICYSLDANLTEEGKESNLYEVVADDNNVIQEFEMSEMLKDVYRKLSGRGRKVLNLLLKGYSKTEIQKACDIKRKALESELQTIRDFTKLCMC